METSSRVREAPRVVYLRIVDTIAERLASGFYGAGTRLPSESQFCAEFGVSHMTLRRALAILADRGLVSPEKGRGVFVSSFDLSDSVFSLRELIRQRIRGPAEAQLLSASTTAANGQVAAILAVSPGDPVVRLRHLVSIDGTPAVYNKEYALHDPRRPLEGLLTQSTSLHGLLDATPSEKFPRGKVTLRACTLGTVASRLLDQPPGAPSLCVEHLFQDTTGRPLGWGTLLLRADLFALHAYLGLEGPGFEKRAPVQQLPGGAENEQ